MLLLIAQMLLLSRQCELAIGFAGLVDGTGGAEPSLSDPKILLRAME